MLFKSVLMNKVGLVTLTTEKQRSIPASTSKILQVEKKIKLHFTFCSFRTQLELLFGFVLGFLCVIFQ